MSKIIAAAEEVNNGQSYTSKVQVNQHSLIIDEPLEKGGQDLVPTPDDYLCAAPGSCKAITLRMYAQRKQWLIEEIKVSVDLVLGKQMESGKNPFYCSISFKGNLDDE